MEQPFKDETLLARWFSGELSQEERQLVEEHPHFEQWKQLADASALLPPPDYNQKSAWKELSQAKEGILIRRKRARFIQLAASIAAIMIVAVGLYLLWPSGGVKKLSTGLAEQQTHILPNQSSVQLNAVSSISYSNVNWHKERIVQLTGEAFFKVESGAPFWVETSKGIIRVVGTEFNVFARPEGFEVSCYEGEVKVEIQNLEAVNLRPGEQGRLVNNQFQKITIPQEQSPGWTVGITKFKNTPLSNVFKELERHTEVTIDFVGEDEHFDGTIPHADLRQSLEIIQDAMNLNVTFVNDKYVRIEEE